jgi:hypothetical protein
MLCENICNKICIEVGSTVRVLEKVNENWWWVESNDDLVGYVPVNHLSDEPLLTDDERWENEEYFEGYGHLVCVYGVVFLIISYRSCIPKC